MTETRWEQARAQERAEGRGGYGEHFAKLLADGADVEGEARLADALVGRGAAILDAGSGMGRVGGALVRRGHRVVGVDFDEELLASPGRRTPTCRWSRHGSTSSRPISWPRPVTRRRTTSWSASAT